MAAEKCSCFCIMGFPIYFQNHTHFTNRNGKRFFDFIKSSLKYRTLLVTIRIPKMTWSPYHLNKMKKTNKNCYRQVSEASNTFKLNLRAIMQIFKLTCLLFEPFYPFGPHFAPNYALTPWHNNHTLRMLNFNHWMFFTT